MDSKDSTFDSGSDDGDKKLSPEERFMDSQTPMENQKRKNREAENDEDTPLPCGLSETKEKTKRNAQKASFSLQLLFPRRKNETY